MNPITRTERSALADLKAEHDELHQMWKRHVTRSSCERCADGRWCRVAGDLAERANTAGLKWEQAVREVGLR